jgi:hypothetical protein
MAEMMAVSTWCESAATLDRFIIPQIVQLVYEYYWRHPPKKISIDALPFHKINHLDSLLLPGRKLESCNEDECYDCVSDEHIGRIGFTHWLGTGESGQPFVIVWVHQSGKIFGVVFLDHFTFDGETLCRYIPRDNANGKTDVYLMHVSHFEYDKKPFEIKEDAFNCILLYNKNTGEKSKQYKFTERHLDSDIWGYWEKIPAKYKSYWSAPSHSILVRNEYFEIESHIPMSLFQL